MITQDFILEEIVSDIDLEDRPSPDIKLNINYNEGYDSLLKYYSKLISNKIDNNTKIPIDIIKKITYDYFGIIEMNYYSRKREYVDARRIAIKLSHNEHKNLSLSNIGNKFNKDHATIIHNERTFDNLYETNDKFRTNVKNIKKLIYG